MRILVVTGSSAGHIFPALSFLERLRDENIKTLLLLPKKLFITSFILNGNQRVRYIPILPVKLNFRSKNLFAILIFFRGFLESLILYLEFRPDVIVGFGSVASLPILLLGWIFRKRTLIHEQNVTPGMANRFLAKFVDRVAISFEESKGYFLNYSKKIILTGNPLRKDLIRIDKEKALNFFGFTDNKFTVLVMGGSLGSHNINVNFVNALSGITRKSELQIIHLAGHKDYDQLLHRYKELDITVKLLRFLIQMQYAYSACDLVISRAGATTVSEIIFFEIPAIIIPYPYAFEHQTENAKILQKKSCAIIIKDNELSPHILRCNIEDLLKHPDKINSMRCGYNNIRSLNANDLLVNEITSVN